jgi:hypothetical protein
MAPPGVQLCPEHEAIYAIGLLQDPANPPCPGPIVVHLDGVIECHGGCDGVALAFHEPGTTAACDALVDDVDLAAACLRCAA